jgi:hypothetical protein
VAHRGNVGLVEEELGGITSRPLEPPGWCGWERERSALRDPLNRPRRYAKLSGDLVKAGPARSRQSVTDSMFHLGGCTRAAEGFAALSARRLGPGNPRAHPLDNHRTLELGEHAHHLNIALPAGVVVSMPC